MRLVSFETGGRVAVGVLDDEGVRELSVADGWPTDMVELIGSDGVMERIEAVIARSRPVHAADVRLLAPVAPRKNVFAVGRNYLEHINEVKEVRPVPDHPIVFTKPPTSVIGPGEAIDLANDPTGTTDYEGELAVVIGRAGVRIDPADVWDHVFGYTIVNDVTARVLQKRHGQWLIGKGPDTFCPMGPAILTADEVDDVAALRVRTSVNGELRQDAPVADLIFDIPTLVATLSAVMTLEPGDVIATGTPGGVGIGFDPPIFLQPGDEVAITIEPIGTLTNPVV